MWQSTISLRYVSYKNADSNLHERICAMAMMAKNLLWSCAPIVAPRPPINPQRPNQSMKQRPHCDMSPVSLPPHPAVAYLYLVRQHRALGEGLRMRKTSSYLHSRIIEKQGQP